MSQLRYNPLLDTWVIHAAARQNRPHLPKDYCPFCPGSGKVPDEYDVLVYPNDFPVLTDDAFEIPAVPDPIYAQKAAYGKCEVILYSPKHDASFSSLPIQQIEKIVRTWKERNDELSRDPKIQYIFPFENRGEEVGVTMHHPHGQLYAYSWVPPKIQEELNNCSLHYVQNETNLFDIITESERRAGTRLLFENDLFIAYLPYFTDYPFGVFVVAKDTTVNLMDFTDKHIVDLAEVLKLVTAAFDKLYDKPFPYMMVIHQSPVNWSGGENAAEFYRFHIEFYPPLRDKDKIKWYASSEMGAGVATNPNSLEECAAQLRDKINEVKNYV